MNHHTDMQGTILGNYRIVRKLGHGGMGTVWLAEHTLLGRLAAIKLLHPAYSAEPLSVKRFFNEARAATSIADPGIVQVFDFGRNDLGVAYIVMEFLDGEALDVRLKRLGRLPLGDALRIMRQVATSLAAAHERGIVHRDLKPENIFLVRDPEVTGQERTKVLDFGIAKLASEGPGAVHTQTAVVMGTPRYMSPEQCRGAGKTDHRSDIYSLGCVLFHLVVGSPPFEGEGGGDVIAMHLREPPPVPSARAPHLPASIDALLLRCLAKPPAERFASMSEVASAISIVLADLAPDADDADVGPRPDPWDGSTTLPSASTTLTAPPLPEPVDEPTLVKRRGTLSASAAPVTAATPSRRGRWVFVAALAVLAGATVLVARGRYVEPISAADVVAPVMAAPADAMVEVAVDAGVPDAAPTPDIAPAPDAAVEPPAVRRRRRPAEPPSTPAPPRDPCDDDDGDGIPDTRC